MRAQFVVPVVVGIILLTSTMTTGSAFVTGGAVTDVSGLAFDYGAGGSSGLPGNNGMFVKLTPPIGPVGNDNHQSHNLFAFDEGQNLDSGGPVAVDLLPSGGSGTLPHGTYASHYVFYDPATDNTIEGCVDFDSDIEGVITSRTNLISSDLFQDTATTGAIYLSPTLRGLENNQDDVAIVDSNTICLAFRASSPGDYIRVLTEFSPLGDDTDDDGILDGNDNCPFVFNPGQEDHDLDDIGTACELDSDLDGIPDDGFGNVCTGGNSINCDDNCPNVVNADQADSDNDQIGDACEPDSDGDGFSIPEDCDDSNPTIFPGATEVCDGADNDCDGAVDEDFSLGLSCSVGVGACENIGVIVCALSGSTTVCSVGAGTPSPEVCTDGIDNDCDGLTDISDPVCQSPEVCDGLDNDGDGEVDENFIDLGQPCSVGVGACQADGVIVCTADGTATQCGASEGTPAPELCDTIDNDCDGTIDNDVDETDPELGVSCSLPFGVGECRNGFNVCTEDGLVCEGNLPMEETCDGLDNDCDGFTDENETGGSVCTIHALVDIKPGSDTNPINCKSKGNTPIAILSDSTFDATQASSMIPMKLNDSVSTSESHNRIHVEDVDGDGILDIVIHIETADICTALGEVQRDDVVPLVIDWQLPDGTPIQGSDNVVLKGKKILEN